MSKLTINPSLLVFSSLFLLAWPWARSAEEYKPEPVSALSAKGALYFKELNCLSCHSAKGVGGDLGPGLDGVGRRRSTEYLLARLSDNPKARERFAQFPGARTCSLGTHPRLSDPVSKAVVAFLLTLGEYKSNPNASPHGGLLPADDQVANPNFVPAVAGADAELGKELYKKNACSACHSIGEVGGWVGPALDGIGGRRSLQFIKEHIVKPKNSGAEGEDAPKSRMPALPLSSAEVDKLAAFLMTLPNPASPASSSASPVGR